MGGGLGDGTLELDGYYIFGRFALGAIFAPEGDVVEEGIADGRDQQ